MNATGRQFLNRFLVANEGHEPVRQLGGQRVGRRVGRPGALDRADLLAIALLVDPGAELGGEDTDPVAAAKKGKIRPGDRGHQPEHGLLDAFFHRGLLVLRIADATGSAADDDRGIVADVETVGYRLLIEADAVGFLAVEPALVEKGFEFAVRCFGFGAQLQDQKRFHDPPQ